MLSNPIDVIIILVLLAACIGFTVECIRTDIRAYKEGAEDARCRACRKRRQCPKCLILYPRAEQHHCKNI